MDGGLVSKNADQPLVFSFTTKPPPTLYSGNTESVNLNLKSYSCQPILLPEILIRSQQLPLLPKHREPYPIRVRLQHLVPAPKHVPVHIIHDPVLPAEKEVLVVEDVGIPGGDRTGVDRLWV